MSEYMEKHSVSRLIGAPPGYVGYEQGGALTEAIRRHPFAVILFDEVEKAHREVFNVFLQILDDGRLTDGQGRVVDFANTIIIMTSNLGSRHLLKMAQTASDSGAEEVPPAIEQAVLGEVKGHFPPELINRIDDIVVFNPLSMANLTAIVQLQAKNLSDRLADRDMVLEITQEALEHVVHESYDPAYGARPIRRYIEKVIGTEISKLILQGTASSGSKIVVTVANGALNYQVVPNAVTSKRQRTSSIERDPFKKPESSSSRPVVEDLD
jgi:ATP-dependent Clp protease ATP-binding subunit ClpB